MILLRSSEQKTGVWKYRIRGADGSLIEQDVKTLYLPALSTDSLFDQELFALLPFYLFTYGAGLESLEKAPDGRRRLLREERRFQERLIKTEELSEGEK